ncbi:DUF4177 domain-containing protein [Dethiothermospora halolimnae]|uniref:DUF4177 domain-containing protein n=1 Tax=Dethiothermospora halolimnae TaxID=3114390 RepID=UPI003CCBF6A0
MYEYKSVEVPLKRGLKVHTGDTFNECMGVIQEHVKEGWRLVQVLAPPSEKTGVYMPSNYQIIFEKEI